MTSLARHPRAIVLHDLMNLATVITLQVEQQTVARRYQQTVRQLHRIEQRLREAAELLAAPTKTGDTASSPKKRRRK